MTGEKACREETDRQKGKEKIRRKGKEINRQKSHKGEREKRLMGKAQRGEGKGERGRDLENHISNLLLNFLTESSSGNSTEC